MVSSLACSIPSGSQWTSKFMIAMYIWFIASIGGYFWNNKGEGWRFRDSFSTYWIIYRPCQCTHLGSTVGRQRWGRWGVGEGRKAKCCQMERERGRRVDYWESKGDVKYKTGKKNRKYGHIKGERRKKIVSVSVMIKRFMGVEGDGADSSHRHFSYCLLWTWDVSTG